MLRNLRVLSTVGHWNYLRFSHTLLWTFFPSHILFPNSIIVCSFEVFSSTSGLDVWTFIVLTGPSRCSLVTWPYHTGLCLLLFLLIVILQLGSRKFKRKSSVHKTVVRNASWHDGIYPSISYKAHRFATYYSHVFLCSIQNISIRSISTQQK